ncbi:competence protein CoiA [Heyndrickxia sp. NPDC080065]|uniref:competence protein CoiA n=1 Tax=Heyndrickxia sp. NPDC080065 TaxID=3390568 RepID=UPI003D0222D6
MLTALTNDGKPVCLIHCRTKNELLNYKRYSFYCPQCREKVILKTGIYKIPHFAHQPLSNCVSSSEPESEIHLQGKIDLYSWLSKRGMDIEMEKYLPRIKQRPDLLVKRNGRVYAFEFQCSSIPVKEMISRSSGYASCDIIPIWILGGEPYQKKISFTENVFQISDFQWSFTQYNITQGMHFYSYSPISKKLNILSHITPLSTRKVLAHQTSVPLSQLEFPFQFPAKEYLKINHEYWYTERKKWLQNKIIYTKNFKDPFLQSTYYNGHSPLLLSPLIGIPVNFMAVCKSHPVVWQYYIWSDGIMYLTAGDEFTLSKIEGVFEKRVLAGDIEVRIFPILKINFQRQMIYHYLKLLSQFGYINEIRIGKYVMNKSLPIPNNIEDVVRQEQEIGSSLLK